MSDVTIAAEIKFVLYPEKHFKLIEQLLVSRHTGERQISLMTGDDST